MELTGTQATAAGYGALRALEALAGAFDEYVPTRADLDAAIRVVEHVRIGNRTLRQCLPVILGDNPAEAKRLLRLLQRVIDRHVSAIKRAARGSGKRTSMTASAEQAIVDNLKTVALYAATRFQSRALTNARIRGVPVAHPSLAHVTRLASDKIRLGKEIPSVIPEVAPEIAYLSYKAEETANDDNSDIGAALAGYSGAVGCGYGATLDVKSSDNDTSDTEEDAQLFLLLPRPSATDLDDASRVFPGAAKALHQGFVSRSPHLSARAFAFLRKQRILNADILWATPADYAQAVGARRQLLAANTLILHWARRFYDRYCEERAHARDGKAATPAVNMSLQLASTTASKNEGASAAASLVRAAHAAHPELSVLPRPRTDTSASALSKLEEGTAAIIAAAKEYGLAVVKKDEGNVRLLRSRLHLLLETRRKLINQQLGLIPAQAKRLFALESQIMTLIASRVGCEFQRGVAAQPPVRAELTAKITAIESHISELRGQRKLLLQLAKPTKNGTGLAGFLGDVSDALGRALQSR